MTGAHAALRDAVARLRAAGVDEPAGDARRLLEHAAGLGRGTLSLHFPDRIPPAALERFAELVARRAERRPVAQITGSRTFYGRDFRVTQDTLDPRPETELLVDLALASPFGTVLDLGTGTGCILLTLLAERPGAKGMGTDLSPLALAVAQENAHSLGIGSRATFLQSDWFTDIPPATFDLIVSNPPYISRDEMEELAPEVRDHEPRAALTDEGDGLAACRHIAAHAGDFLVPGGRLLLEIGHLQGKAAAMILTQAGFSGVTIHHDLAGNPRIVAANRRSA